MSRKILIIDDSSTVRQQVRSALNVEFEMLEAADGVEGLQSIDDNADLAAVICDVNMPRMGGLEMLEMAKARGTLAQLPVLMLTTEGQPALMQRAKAIGAKGWVVKPFKPELLLATIRKIAKLEEGSA